MVNAAVNKESAIGVASEALVPERALILVIGEGQALVVAHDVGKIGFNDVVLAAIGEVESSDGESALEGFVGRVIQRFVGCVIPESRVFIAVVACVCQIVDSVLPY